MPEVPNALQGAVPITVPLPTPESTAQLGVCLLPVLQPGDIVALHGDLGAGKTTLARGLIQGAMGVDTDVPSPTFTLVQTYDLDGFELWHFDLYRLETPEDVFELGIEESFIDCVSVIEWPDRMGPYLPKDHLAIRLEHRDDGREAIFDGPKSWLDRIGPVVR